MKKISTVLSYTILCTSVPAVLYRFFEADSILSKLDLLGYFTIQSNIMVIGIVFLSLLGVAVSERWKLAAAAAIIITAVIYQLFLRGSVVQQGVSLLISNVNHGSTTVLYLLWFWFTGHRGQLKTRDIWTVIPYPALYCIFGICEGFIKNSSRYFFLDIRQIGWSGFALWFVGLTLFFLGSGFFVIYINDKMSVSVKP